MNDTSTLSDDYSEEGFLKYFHVIQSSRMKANEQNFYTSLKSVALGGSLFYICLWMKPKCVTIPLKATN